MFDRKLQDPRRDSDSFTSTYVSKEDYNVNKNYKRYSEDFSSSSFDNSSNQFPSLEEMNLYADRESFKPNGSRIRKASKNQHSNRTWVPVTNLIPTKESMHLRRHVSQLLKRVHQEISSEELELRTNTPEFVVVKDDWVAHTEKNEMALMLPLTGVARLPADLIVPGSAPLVQNIASHDIAGYLRKKGKNNKALKNRYIELKGTKLTYYKRESHAGRSEKIRGQIDLDAATSIYPMDKAANEFGFHIEAKGRIWAFVADTEADFMNWAKSISSVVKFQAVHRTFKHMFQLQELSAQAVTDVRMPFVMSDTVGKIVKQIFAYYKEDAGTGQLKSHDPNHYVLKVTGYRDYLLDRFRIMNEYVHVRECLLTRKKIRLTVIHESVVNQLVKLSTANYSTLSWGTVASIGEWNNLEACRGRTSTVFSNGSTASSGDIGEDTPVVPSLIKGDPLKIVIHRIWNIPNTICVLKREREGSYIDRLPLTTYDIITRFELYDNGELLDGCVVDTPLTKLKDQNHNGFMVAEWISPVQIVFAKAPITLLSQSTRLQISVVVVQKDLTSLVPQEKKLLITGVNIFEVDGLMISSTQYVGMHNNLHSFIQGPVPHAVYQNQPVVHLEFPTYASPVKFDWTAVKRPESVQRLISKMSIATQREHTLRKEGVLKKLGSIKYTKWRERRFLLDQASCTLTYADDQTSRKNVINLKGSAVSLADEMNEMYTTYPVNSGTRKERHTYCFKVMPHRTSREYILSAATKQEREQWMLAIGHVAQNEMASTTIIESLRNLIKNDPLYRMDKYEKFHLWKHREMFIDIFAALPHVLTCVNWTDPEEIAIIMDLLPKWSSPDHPAAYIILLNGEFSHEGVREFAVKKLELMADATFSYFLPQLVQALKFENHHVSALSTMLIERAIKNPNQIGFDLFWAMKVESHNQQYKERYGEILNAYLDVCSHKMCDILKLQDKLFAEGGRFDKICQIVKDKKKDGAAEMKRVLHDALDMLNRELPSSFQLPLDPRCEVGKIIVHKCKVMDSAKKPLWLVFENAEEGGDPVTVMFKAGDDVRQDCLTLQLIRLMDEMWRDEGLDLAMEPYKCVATSPMTGILQIVMSSVTTAEVHKRANGRMGAFSDDSFLNWIKSNNRDNKSFKAAIDIFTRSCAGYCVATGVLGIGDRHNDNIMITTGGRYFHIDFGHFLGHLKYHMGVKRERTPFVFTKEMAYVFGGKETKEFQKFVDTACRAYSVVRRHMHLLSWLLIVMIPADMPELTGRDDINYIVDFIAPELTEVKALSNFTSLIFNAIQDTSKRFDNTIHILAH